MLSGGRRGRRHDRGPAVSTLPMAQHPITEGEVTTMRPTALTPPCPSLADAPSSSEAGHPAPPGQQGDERALLCRGALQEPQTFALLYARFAPPARRYLHRCLRQANLVDDVLQEGMLVLL